MCGPSASSAVPPSQERESEPTPGSPDPGNSVGPCGGCFAGAVADPGAGLVPIYPYGLGKFLRASGAAPGTE